MKLRRNIILSLKDIFDTALQAEGFTGSNNFTFVSSWSQDDKIVTPDNYIPDSGLVKLPAGNISILNRRGGEKIEIGGTGQYTYVIINVFIHAITDGQLTDLLDIFHETLSDDTASIGSKKVVVNDFTTTGYPSVSASELYKMEIQNPVSKPVGSIDSENIALRYAGSITATGKLLRSV